ncbi:response regulator transcription factor [Streptosporangium sp. NPDC051022]|uniref:response regulator transcription factor n=1 Tax=Streptosporangium sp. NPDC051022 TaxID=3155752 RepID=UPI003432801A
MDDHAMVRRGLAAFFDEVADIQVVGEAADGRGAIDALQDLAERGRLPDVVLMDLVMPGLDGVAATKEITTRFGLAVIVITTFSEAERVLAAMKAGATGYLLKNAELEQLVAAVRGARQRRTYIDPLVAGSLSDAATGQGLGSLTDREREVLALVADGLSNRAIAERLHISERTARTHVSRILAKIDATSRTQAALWARRNGLGTDVV